MATVSRHIAVLATIMTLGFPCSATADPIGIGIRVTSGTIFVGGQWVEGAFSNIAGPDFSFRASSDALLDAHACNPCVPGQTISFSGFLPPSFFGPLVYQGRTFELGFQNSGGGLFLDAPAFVLPASNDGRISFTTPFSLAGSVRIFEPIEEGAGGFEFSLQGNGRATGTFVVGALPEGTFINALGFTFDFGAEPAPVPEPASLVLLGAGLAGAIVQTARRRSKVRQNRRQ